jgi:hypothetical protein
LDEVAATAFGFFLIKMKRRLMGGLLPFNLGRLQSPFGRLLNGGFWPTIG